VLAQGIGLLAEIAFDLKQALLERCVTEELPARIAQHPLSREAERRVVLGRRPSEVALFGDLPEVVIAANDGAHSEPGQDHIDREISNALRTEERLWAREPGGAQVPVP
jgi:hypothetical protein